MAEEELGPKPLSKSRIKYADKMFDAYDENGSGTLDIEEFCQIMQRYDPDLDPVSVPAHLYLLRDARLMV